MNQRLWAVAALTVAITTGTAQTAREKTTFQTSSHWKPVTDIRADVVMCYGANDSEEETFCQRVDSWRQRGYTTHFMTGIAWGEYQDYFTGKWDGMRHLDEGQKTMQGDTLWHGHNMPYIVPTMHYLKYFKERHIRPVIDAGIDAIFLEEPEFWAQGGYSEAFKREWNDFYGFPWRPQHESAENTYLSNKLKYHLYYRALDEAFTYAKAYGKSKGMDVRCYVPTHSLLNYSLWQIVSPEASLASMKSCDGYIAQVWTGTSRVPNYYDGVMRERVFETAFLEYGCMQSMTDPTGRKMFFLTDPIEDRGRDWDDYKRNYQATFTAQLLYPGINTYEVMPWPDRIYEHLYKAGEGNDDKTRIPRPYSTQMQVMINALGDMPLSSNQVSGTHGVNVLMANSLMFQRSDVPVEGYDDPQLSNFYGEVMPLIKRGIPVGITHIENVGYADAWKGVKVLLMSYSNMKPLSPEAHRHIADWVKGGGTLVYSGRDDDAFQRVNEWWNQDSCSYGAPSEHLFELMGMPRKAVEGEYSWGNGHVWVLRHDPKEYAMLKGGDDVLVNTVKKAVGEVLEKNSFYIERGCYDLAAVVDESPAGNSPYTVSGHLIDLFNPALPTMKAKTVLPGEQAMLFDVARVADRHKPQVLAAASRQYDEQRTANSFSFTAKSPANTDNVMRILLPHKPKKISVESAAKYESEWTKGGFNTLLLKFENNPDGVRVKIEW